MVASLVGDPARANILTALMTGRALTASELAHQAGVTPQTASGHLAKLTEGGLLTQRKQGRHAYFALAGEDVAQMLEALMGLAARAGFQAGDFIRAVNGKATPSVRDLAAALATPSRGWAIDVERGGEKGTLRF